MEFPHLLFPNVQFFDDRSVPFNVERGQIIKNSSSFTN